MAKNQKNQGFAAIRDVVSSSRFRESRLQADPETCHAVVGNRKFSATIFDDVVKERNNGTAASGYIAITNDGEADILASGIGVGCDKQFIGH